MYSQAGLNFTKLVCMWFSCRVRVFAISSLFIYNHKLSSPSHCPKSRIPIPKVPNLITRDLDWLYNALFSRPGLKRRREDNVHNLNKLTNSEGPLLCSLLSALFIANFLRLNDEHSQLPNWIKFPLINVDSILSVKFIHTFLLFSKILILPPERDPILTTKTLPFYNRKQSARRRTSPSTSSYMGCP